MSVNGWKVADSDMHVMEPADLWERYIAPEWRHAAPIGLAELHRDMRVRVKGTVLTRVAPAKPSFDVTVGWKPNQDSAFAAAEARGLGREVAAPGDGRRGPRRGRAVPQPGTLRARARQQ